MTANAAARVRGPRRPGRVPAVAVALAAAVLAGCGIRSVEVPVDAGPAPSRATCVPPGAGAGGTEVFLICGSRVEAVERTVPGATGTDEADPGDEAAGARRRVSVATALLAQLQSDPGDAERAAGFTSAVPAGLRVSGPVGDDPVRVLRLSEHPDRLPAFALVQIICTFARTEPVGDGASVLLGGPPAAGDPEPRGYTCAASLRHRPESAYTAGRSL